MGSGQLSLMQISLKVALVLLWIKIPSIKPCVNLFCVAGTFPAQETTEKCSTSF